MQTKVVIFILTYNRVNYLKSAIESILNQTYSDFILNVLDNCSNDGTEEYVKSIEDKIKELEKEKEAAVASQNFEKAAKLRDEQKSKIAMVIILQFFTMMIFYMIIY